MWAQRVAAGGVKCARPDCTFPGGLIQPGQAWDLDHDDSDPTHQRYLGASHASCNRRTVTHLKQQLGQRQAHAAAATAGVKDPRTGMVREPGESEREHWLKWGPPNRWSRHWLGGYTDRCPDCRRLGEACEVAQS